MRTRRDFSGGLLANLMILRWVSNRLPKGTHTRLVAVGAFVFFCLALYFLPGYASTAVYRFSAKNRKSKNLIGGSELLRNRVAPHSPDLQDVSVTHHGRIVEVKGGAESGSIVMINGEPAVTFFDGHRFKHFIGPISPGTTLITITVQNESGGVTTRQLAVTID